MKKAKIVLTAIGLFAVVGGSLAFKVKRAERNVYCSTRTGTPAVLTCNQITNYKTVIEDGVANTTQPCTFNGSKVKTYYTNTILCTPLSGTVYVTSNI